MFKLIEIIIPKPLSINISVINIYLWYSKEALGGWFVPETAEDGDGPVSKAVLLGLSWRLSPGAGRL